MKQLRILVVGSINMDLCLETDRVPAPGEALMCSKEYNYINGGKGANQAVAAMRLGAEATFVGKVGNDTFGNELTKALSDIGVRTDYLHKEDGIKTGFVIVIIEDNGQNRMLVYPESNMKLSKEDIDAAMREKYDAMIIQLEIPKDIVIYACHVAREKNLPFFVDAGPAMDFPIEEIPGAEILSPNETETYAMCKLSVKDIHTAEAAARILMERSKAKYIVIKSGEHGAYLYDGKNIKHIPAYEVTAIDPTAAGDAFTAAMTIRYLQCGDIETAMKFAHAAGAVAVTRVGAQPSIPTLAEVEEFQRSAVSRQSK